MRESLFHVKQVPAEPVRMFHVKHALTLTVEISFPDAELPEDHVKDVFDIDPAEKSSE